MQIESLPNEEDEENESYTVHVARPQEEKDTEHFNEELALKFK